jgi:hypothetical protein
MSGLALGRRTQRMSQRSVVSSPATGGFRGNGRKANLEERSYE